MNRYLLLLCLLLLSYSARLQTISEIVMKSDENGGKKLKKAPKKIYISEFRVNYQMLHIAEDSKRGDKDASDGMITGDIKVILGLGLNGLNDNDLINNTNYLYNQFTQRLKEKGYEILTADAAAGIKEFKGWERKVGGTISQAQFKGYITSMPTGFNYYVKGTTSTGREKQTFTDNSAKVSHQLDNATVVRVNLFVPIAENGESWTSQAFLQDFVTKVVLETNLCLDDDIATASKGGGYSQTGVSFINSEAMGLPTSMNVYNLKKPVEISGVLEKKKYKYQGRQDIDGGGITQWYGSSAIYKVFSVKDVEMKKIIPIDVDPAKYNAGVRMACEAFMNKATDEFLKNAE